MKQVIYGQSITFEKQFINSAGQAVDPPTVTASIVRNASGALYGPYTYTYGAGTPSTKIDFIRLSVGNYRITQLIEEFIVPGIYSLKWSAQIDGVTSVWYENFQVVDPPVENARIVDPNRLYGEIKEVPLYKDMGYGKTDTILLIGHGDGLELNVPHQVINMRETVNLLGADSDCPLIRGLFEAYNGGARDVWLMASAPMAEYVPFNNYGDQDRKVERDEWSGLNFYQRYSQRLETTYDILRNEIFPQIIVPLEAPFYDSGDVDFLTPLLFNCFERYKTTGFLSMGIIGTRIYAGTETIVEDLLNDFRISTQTANTQDSQFSTSGIYQIIKYNYGIDLTEVYTKGGDLLTTNADTLANGADIGKFGMVIVGEGAFQLPQFNLPFTSSLAVTAAAKMSTLDLNKSLVNKNLPRVVNLIGYKFTKEEILSLARKRFNVATLTPLGRRGTIYETYLPTDNTLANGFPVDQGENFADGRYFWSASIMRVTSKICQDIMSLGNRSLGTVNYAQFKKSVQDYLIGLIYKGIIRDFSLDIYRVKDENQTVFVDLILNPYFSIREIYFTVKVGPGTGE